MGAAGGVWLGVITLAHAVYVSDVPEILTVLLAGQQREQSRWRGFALALAYVSGMAVVYALIGVVAARTGLALQSYLQNPWVLLGFAALLVFAALSIADVFQVQMSARWQSWLQAKAGKTVIGARASWGQPDASASPCVTAPLVGLIATSRRLGRWRSAGWRCWCWPMAWAVPLLLLGAGLGQWPAEVRRVDEREIEKPHRCDGLGVAVWVAQRFGVNIGMHSQRRGDTKMLLERVYNCRRFRRVWRVAANRC